MSANMKTNEVKAQRVVKSSPDACVGVNRANPTAAGPSLLPATGMLSAGILPPASLRSRKPGFPAILRGLFGPRPSAFFRSSGFGLRVSRSEEHTSELQSLRHLV